MAVTVTDLLQLKCRFRGSAASLGRLLSFSLLAQGSHAGAGFGSARPRGAGLRGAEGTAGRPRASPPSRLRRSLRAGRAEQPPPVTSAAEILSAGGSAELSRCFSPNRRLYQKRHMPYHLCRNKQPEKHLELLCHRTKTPGYICFGRGMCEHCLEKIAQL